MGKLKTEYWITLIEIAFLIFISYVFRVLWKRNKKDNAGILDAKKRGTKRHQAKINIRKRRVVLILCILLMAGDIWEIASSFCISEEIKIVEDSIIKRNANYRAMEKIVFDEDLKNEDELIWEHFINEELGIRDIMMRLEESESFDVLRNNTIDSRLLEYNDIVSIEELKEHVDHFKETGIFPELDMSLSEIEAMTPPIDERQNDDWELFAKECIIRINGYQESSAAENLYQIARAADDAFKLLFPLKKDAGSKKRALFFGAIAVASYKLYILECDAEDEAYVVDLSFIYYRLGEIDIYFYRYYESDSDENEQIRECFVLGAESYLDTAEKNFRREHGEEDIHKYLPYYGAYRADIFYRYYTLYAGANSGFYGERCCEYSESYLKSEYAKGGERSSCEDYLTNIKERESIDLKVEK